MPMRYLVGVPLFVFIWVVFCGFVCCQRPAIVNIGAIFTFDSVIGRTAKLAMEAAVSDVNADPMILNGTELKFFMKDVNCNAFMGSIEAFQLIENKVVAIIGPQSSSIAHIISEVANGFKVPLVSYAATDPTLSALQFPYFVRTTQSDSHQMTAMADFIDFHGWKEVIAIYVDDDYGRNGISALNNLLDKKVARVSYKLPLPVQFNQHDITDLLNKSKPLGPRVYVVHVNPDPGLRIFTVAQKLQMMTSNYVWLATEWLSATLDSFSSMNQLQTSAHVLQGVVGFRQHIPESIPKKAFLSRWSKMQQKGLVSSGLNTYGLYAYDTVWAVARSVDKLIDESNINFSVSDKLLDTQASKMKQGQLKAFDGGALLLGNLLKTNFTGLTGRVHFNKDRNIVSGGYEVINIDKMEIQRVGYWSDGFGFSVLAPETMKGKKNFSHSHQDWKLLNITWPGGKTERPRGWEIANDARPLRIGVPKRVSFVDFVTEDHNSHKIHGYCIDVFLEARKLLPYDLPYRFEPFGDGLSNPSYEGLVKMVANDVFDAAVGDITIVTSRMRIVDFSQPYVATGLVIVAPINNHKSSAWVFLQPFTVEMWCVTAAFFVMIAVVIRILEHRVNDDFRGSPKRQLVTMCLFGFSTLFKKNKEAIVSTPGRFVMVVWLFLLMVITSSYTASLSSILTVQQLSTSITGIESLISSDWPIGYQGGSFAYSYLLDALHIHHSRLVSLGSPEDYERALRQGPSNGGVAAIVDEIAYVELFLSSQTDFGIIGQPFTKTGWGFAFQRDSPLAVDMSTAILKLSEYGMLQQLHEKWFCKEGYCPEEKGQNSEPHQLHLSSFWGLYGLSGIITLTVLLVFLLRMVRQYVRYKQQQMHPQSPHASSSSSSTASCSKVFYNFFDFIDEKEEAIKKRFTKNDCPQVNANPATS